MPESSAQMAGGANVLVFLDPIAFSEGTSIVKGSDDGYNVLYGGDLFQGYQDHPCRRLTFPINGKLVTSTRPDATSCSRATGTPTEPACG